MGKVCQDSYYIVGGSCQDGDDLCNVVMVDDVLYTRRSGISGKVDRGIEEQVHGERDWDRDISDAIVGEGLLLGEILDYYRRLKGNIGATADPAKYLRGNK